MWHNPWISFAGLICDILELWCRGQGITFGRRTVELYSSHSNVLIYMRTTRLTSYATLTSNVDCFDSNPKAFIQST